ncbi:unnamed protein product [Rotaria magnacalcarata]
MYPNFHYTSSFPQQQSQPIQWGYQPSFYNGYATSVPIILTQPVPVVQNYLTPLQQQQQQQQHRIDTQLSSYPPSMKTYNRFRNAFSCSHQQDSNNSDDEYLYHEQQLNRNLTKHGIERLPVKGDGNCLFYALAEGLMYEMKVDPHDFGLQLQQLFRLSKNFRLVDFADCLRQLCVDQWRLHEDYYSQFVDKEKVSFLKEVKKFSKNGVSDSTLGDIVPLTTANALNINITIFTSVSNLPRIDVKPERISHYDAAYPRT